MLLTVICVDLCYGLCTSSNVFCVYFFIVEKLLETNDSMHRLMQQKGQLIANLLQIPYDDYESVSDVRNVNLQPLTA